jgi:hypothetical protein
MNIRGFIRRQFSWGNVEVSTRAVSHPHGMGIRNIYKVVSELAEPGTKNQGL